VGDGLAGNARGRLGDIWINTEHDTVDWGPGWNAWRIDTHITPGTFGHTVLLQEIAHALGVDTYDVNTYKPNNIDINNVKYTITAYPRHKDMLYASELVDKPYGDKGRYGAFPKGLQLFDIAALQEIWGRNYKTRQNDNIYDRNYAFKSDEKDGSFIYTIWDGGGTDRIDAYDYRDDGVEIDLRQGHFSSIGNRGDGTSVPRDIRSKDNKKTSYDAGNLAIAYFTIIENASGTDKDDRIIGNAWNNTLHGVDGDDHIYGDGVVYDQDPGEHLWEPANPAPRPADDESGSDLLFGGKGNDYLSGGRGSDVITGGAGSDTFLWSAEDLDGSIDIIKDFSLSDNDKLDLSGAVSYDDQKVIKFTDFGKIIENGADSAIQIDADGKSNGSDFSTIAILENVNGLTDITSLVNSGNLIIVKNALIANSSMTSGSHSER